ncbi:MAG: glycosyltransferase 87 family protein [Clostridia bacterium]|nr:glycosyltransferase 87 family protein [Clostridia bacterium]
MKKFLSSVKNKFAGWFPFDTKENIKRSVLKVLVIIDVIFLLFAVVYLCGALAYSLTNKYSLTDKYPEFYEGIFSDFSQIGFYALRRDAFSMEVGSSYSAFFLLLMYPFALIFKKDINVAEELYGLNFDEPQNLVIISSWRFWVSYLLFYAVCFVLLYFVTRAYIKKHNLEINRVFLVFLLSGPTIFTMIRGNMLFPALILTMVFLCWHDSKNPVLVELSILSLAVAGVLKLYPLIFCVFLLKDKKWFQVVRLALYFAIFYIVPCFCFEGGVKAYIHNLLNFSVGESDLRYVTMKNLSFTSIVYKILFAPAVALGVKHYAVFDWISVAFAIALLVFIFITSIRTQSHFKTCLLCLCAIILVPPVSYSYSLTFLWIVFLTYFKDFSAHSMKQNLIFLISTLIVYILPISWFGQIVISILFIVLTFVTGVSVFKEKKLEVDK